MRFNNFWSYRSILLSGGFFKSVLNSRRNLIAAGEERPLPAGPYMAELDITYQCNLRCRMCQRWRPWQRRCWQTSRVSGRAHGDEQRKRLGWRRW